MSLSWFYIAAESKGALDNYTLFNNILLGGYIKQAAYNKVTSISPYQSARTAFATAFAAKVTPHLVPYSRDIALNIIERSLKKEKLLYVKQSLVKHIKTLSTRQLLDLGKGAMHTLFQATYNRITQRGNNNETSPSNEQNPGATEGKYAGVIPLIRERRYGRAVKTILISNLLPGCEKAIQASIVSAVNASGAQVFDTGIKLFASFLFPVAYSIGLNSICLVALRYFKAERIVKVVGYLSSDYSILWISLAIQIGKIGYDLWYLYKEKQNHPNSSDKLRVKYHVTKLAKEPITKALNENAFLQSTGLLKERGVADQIAETLINEIVEFYWPDLTRKKILGLPLTC